MISLLQLVYLITMQLEDQVFLLDDRTFRLRREYVFGMSTLFKAHFNGDQGNSHFLGS